jgi:hypothetical protein
MAASPTKTLNARYFIKIETVFGRYCSIGRSKRGSRVARPSRAEEQWALPLERRQRNAKRDQVRVSGLTRVHNALEEGTRMHSSRSMSEAGE